MTTLTRRSLLAATLASPALVFLNTPAAAREPEIFAKGGVAINATDPVAYFTQNGPVPGAATHSVNWKGADWHFADADSAARFENMPMDFAPQFGGYCAFAASRGYLAPTIPEAWTVHNGQLFLNANLRARELWLADMEANIAKGRENWPGILG